MTAEIFSLAASLDKLRKFRYVICVMPQSIRPVKQIPGYGLREKPPVNFPDKGDGLKGQRGVPDRCPTSILKQIQDPRPIPQVENLYYVPGIGRNG